MSLRFFFLPFQLSNWTFHRFQSSGWRWICKWENMSSTSSSLHPMCRSFSAESQKKDWSKRLSLRGNPRSKEVLKKYFHLIFSFSTFFPFSWFQSRDLEPNPRTKSLEKSWVEKSNLISAKCLFTFDNFIWTHFDSSMGNQFKQFHGCYVRVFIQFLFNFITFVGVQY